MKNFLVAFVVLVCGLSVSAQSKKATSPVKAVTHSVTVSWTGPAITGQTYNVYRAPCTGTVAGTTNANGSVVGTCSTAGTKAVLGNVSTVSFTDASVALSQSYAYSVTTVCPSAGCSDMSVGESVPSNVIGVKMMAPPPPPPPPGAPTGVSAVVN